MSLVTDSGLPSKSGLIRVSAVGLRVCSRFPEELRGRHLRRGRSRSFSPGSEAPLEQSHSLAFGLNGVLPEVRFGGSEVYRDSRGGRAVRCGVARCASKHVEPRRDEHVEVDGLRRRKVNDRDVLKVDTQVFQHFDGLRIELCGISSIARHLGQSVGQNSQCNDLGGVANATLCCSTARDINCGPDGGGRGDCCNGAKGLTGVQMQRLPPQPPQSGNQDGDVAGNEDHLMKRSHELDAAIGGASLP